MPMEKLSSQVVSQSVKESGGSGRGARSFELNDSKDHEAAWTTAQLRRAGSAGKGDPGVLVEGLRRSDYRRFRRRDGRWSAEPVRRLRGQADVIPPRSQGVRREEGRVAAKALLSPRIFATRLPASCGTSWRARPRASPAGCLCGVAPLVDDAEVREFLQNATAGGVAIVELRFRTELTWGRLLGLSCRRAGEPGHRPCPWFDRACKNGHPEQDASPGCRGSDRLGAPVAAWKCGTGFLKLHGVTVGASYLRWRRPLGP